MRICTCALQYADSKSLMGQTKISNGCCRQTNSRWPPQQLQINICKFKNCNIFTSFIVKNIVKISVNVICALFNSVVLFRLPNLDFNCHCWTLISIFFVLKFCILKGPLKFLIIMKNVCCKFFQHFFYKIQHVVQETPCLESWLLSNMTP